MRKKIIIIGILVLYTILIMLPPLAYGYIYPNNGDDSAFHLRYFEIIRENGSINPQYLGQDIVGLPLVWVSIITGVSINILFLWFNFVVLWLIGICAFALIAKFIDWKAGLLVIPMVMFMTPSTLNLFDSGAIYDLMTVGVVLPLFLFCGMQWWSTKKWQWAIPFGVFLVMAIAVHSFVIIKAVINGNGTAEKAIPTLGEFVGIVLGYGTTLLLVVSILIFGIYYKKLKMDSKTKMLLICLTSILIVLTVLVFTGAIGWSLRIALDLAIILPLFIACLIGIILKTVKIPFWAIALCVLGSSIPLMAQYVEYNSAVKPIDKEVIAYVNSLEGDYFSCSSEVAPWIYERFLNKDYREGELPYIDRNKPMTPRTMPNTIAFWGVPENTLGYYWSGETKPKGNAVIFKDAGITIEVIQ